MVFHFKSGLIVFALAIVIYALPSLGQTSEPTPLPAGQQLPDQQLSGSAQSGSIQGTVVDTTGAVVAGAHVQLIRDDQPQGQEVLSGADGQFSFTNIAAGPFHLTITSVGFATQTSAAVLHPGEIYTAPPIALAVAAANTEVQVTPLRVEVAEDQI